MTKRRRGFTLVELLMVVTLTTVGFVGLFSLQASTIRGMGNMVRMQQATSLAENFIENLRLEFSSWTATQPLSNPSLFPHLAGLPTNDASQAGAQTPGDGVEAFFFVFDSFFGSFFVRAAGDFDRRVEPVRRDIGRKRTGAGKRVEFRHGVSNPFEQAFPANGGGGGRGPCPGTGALPQARAARP